MAFLFFYPLDLSFLNTNASFYQGLMLLIFIYFEKHSYMKVITPIFILFI